MKITIVGGGNIGTQFAVHCAEKGHEVVVYTSTPELFNGHLRIVDENNSTIHEGNICFATADPQIAFREAELILVTVPATIMKLSAEAILDYCGKNTIIGTVPGNGGSECMFRKCIEKGNTFFAIERVPAIARLVQKGYTVKCTGYRKELFVAAIPRYMAELCADLMNKIFGIPCNAVSCMLNLTLTPSNPILHTARLYTLFKDWRKDSIYSSIPLFYEHWDNASSELLLAMDDENQSICRALPELQLEHVKSLRTHYEASTVEAMTNKIRSIRAFKGLTSPVLEVAGGFIPDLHSRYFTSDFAYGLSIIKQVGDIAEVDTPRISSVLAWYEGIAIEKNEFHYSDYGISDRKSLRDFYLNFKSKG